MFSSKMLWLTVIVPPDPEYMADPESLLPRFNTALLTKNHRYPR